MIAISIANTIWSVCENSLSFTTFTISDMQVKPKLLPLVCLKARGLLPFQVTPSLIFFLLNLMVETSGAYKSFEFFSFLYKI